MLRRIGRFLSRHRPLLEGRRVGVAVSGGSDSVALLHLLATLADGLKMELAVLHFHHGLRGAEADADEHFVADVAQTLGMPFHRGRWRKAPDSNLEAEARKARLAFFREQRQRLDLAYVATGHTRDDQAETVMLRILRGSGLTGLSAVLPITREGLIRPLLECTRAELREWLTGRSLGWREDATNLEPDFATRNRMRLGLLPELRREWNPEIDQALARLAAVAQDEETYWSGETERLLPDDLIFETATMLSFPVAVQRRLVRAAIGRAKGDLRKIEFQHIERALELFVRTTGDGSITLPGSVFVERSFDKVRVARAVPNKVADVRWRERSINLPEMGAYNGGRYYLDAEKVTLPLRLRSWNQGDLFCPASSPRSKSMKELFQRARVPRWERARWPMLLSGETVVWTRGFGVASGFEAAPGTRAVLEVEDSEKFGRIVESNLTSVASITVG